MLSGKVLFWESNIFSELFVTWRLLGQEITWQAVESNLFSTKHLTPPLHAWYPSNSDMIHCGFSGFPCTLNKTKNTQFQQKSLPKNDGVSHPSKMWSSSDIGSPTEHKHPWLWSGEGGTVRPFRTKASIQWVHGRSHFHDLVDVNWCFSKIGNYTGNGKIPQKNGGFIDI